MTVEIEIALGRLLDVAQVAHGQERAETALLPFYLRHSREGGNPYFPAAGLAISKATCADDKQPRVDILASGMCGIPYVRVTSNLVARLHQHREGLIEGFTSRYGVIRLVRFELFDDMANAIVREKQLKKWNRDWKLNLIESENPGWVDLAEGFGFAPTIPKR